MHEKNNLLFICIENNFDYIKFLTNQNSLNLRHMDLLMIDPKNTICNYWFSWRFNRFRTYKQTIYIYIGYVNIYYSLIEINMKGKISLKSRPFHVTNISYIKILSMEEVTL